MSSTVQREQDAKAGKHVQAVRLLEQRPFRFFCLDWDHFLLLNKLFISSWLTNRSTFEADCITAPSSSFWNPSP